MKIPLCVTLFISYLVFASAIRRQDQNSLRGDSGFLSNIAQQENIAETPYKQQKSQDSHISDKILLTLDTVQDASAQGSTTTPPSTATASPNTSTEPSTAAQTTAQAPQTSTGTQQTSADNTAQTSTASSTQSSAQSGSVAAGTGNATTAANTTNAPPPEPISCSGTDNKFVASVCSLCQAQEAYILTKDNWFALGLVHNYKTELSKILTHVESIFSNARWLAAFSDEHICVVSSTEMTGIDVDNAVFSFTGQHLRDYIKATLVPLTNSTKVYESGFRYVPLGQDSYIDEFLLQYQINFTMPTSDDSSLELTKALVTTSTKKVVYSGTINLKNTTKLPFELDASEAADYYYASASIPDLGFTTSEILSRISVPDSGKKSIFEKITPTNGPANLDKYQAALLSFRLVNVNNTLDQLKIQLGTSLDFAITPEFRLTNGKTTILINMAAPESMPSLLIEGQAKPKNGDKTLVAKITKNEQEQTIVLSQDQESLQVSDLESIFKDKQSSNNLVIPKHDNFNAIRKLSLQETQINVRNNPIPVYQITSKLLSGTDNVGNLDLLVAFVGGTANSQSKIVLPTQALEIILPENSTPLFFEQYITSNGLEITHYNHDLDTQQYSPILDGIYNGDRYWNQGTTVAYKFLLDKCADVAFCQVMTNMMDCQTTPLNLHGKVDHDGTIELATDILPGNISITTISFTEIRLNLNLIMKENLQFELYLTSKNTFKISEEKTLTLDGKLNFDETHGRLASKTPETWKNALGLEFLHISGPELTGVVNPGACEIEDLAANGVMLWGRDCIIINPENFYNVTFLKERCFFGKGEISLNLNDLQKSYVTGIYSGVTPVMALSSILGYDDSFILQKVSKVFMDNKFQDFIEISYVPKKGSSTPSTTTSTTTEATSTPVESTPAPTEPAPSDETSTTTTTTTTTTTSTTETVEATSPEAQATALVEVAEGVPAGLSITGRSELLGLQGVTTLHVDIDTKELLGMFNFETFQIANGNIVFKRSSTENSNNIVFKISTGFEDSVNNQAQMQANLNMLGLDGEATFTMLDDDVSFAGVLNSEVLESIEVKGSIQGSQNLATAAFNVQGNVNDSLTSVDTLIQDAAADWSERMKNLINEIEQTLLDLKTLTEAQGELLCKNDTCPQRAQCRSDPRFVCTKYQKKEICNNTEDYCLNAVLTCSKQEEVCINEVNTCVRQDQASKTCVESKKECKAKDSVCTEWSYTCQGGTIMTCENFDVIDDPAECLEFGWECDELQVTDPQCKSACELRSREYKELNQTYLALTIKYGAAKVNHQKILDFVEFLQNATDNSQGFQFSSFKFEVELDKKLQRKDVPWKAEYTLLGQNRTADITNLNLMDKQEFTNTVFTTIGSQFALEKGFKWRKPQDIQAEIDDLFSGSTQAKAAFLQKFQKLNFANILI